MATITTTAAFPYSETPSGNLTGRHGLAGSDGVNVADDAFRLLAAEIRKQFEVNFDNDVAINNELVAFRGNGAVDTDNLADEAVTAPKIDENAITREKIGNSAVGHDELGSDAVDTDNVVNGAITHDKLGATAVEADNIANGAVTVNKIGPGAIAGSQIASATIARRQLIRRTLPNKFSRVVHGFGQPGTRSTFNITFPVGTIYIEIELAAGSGGTDRRTTALTMINPDLYFFDDLEIDTPNAIRASGSSGGPDVNTTGSVALDSGLASILDAGLSGNLFGGNSQRVILKSQVKSDYGLEAPDVAEISVNSQSVGTGPGSSTGYAIINWWA